MSTFLFIEQEVLIKNLFSLLRLSKCSNQTKKLCDSILAGKVFLFNHRHQITKTDLLLAHTACLVCLVITVSGCAKVPLEDQALVACK
jgi:hypothetical protein